MFWYAKNIIKGQWGDAEYIIKRNKVLYWTYNDFVKRQLYPIDYGRIYRHNNWGVSAEDFKTVQENLKKHPPGITMQEAFENLSKAGKRLQKVLASTCWNIWRRK